MANYMVKNNKQTSRGAPPPKPIKINSKECIVGDFTCVLNMEIQPQPEYVLINGVKYVKEGV